MKTRIFLWAICTSGSAAFGNTILLDPGQSIVIGADEVQCRESSASIFSLDCRTQPGGVLTSINQAGESQSLRLALNMCDEQAETIRKYRRILRPDFVSICETSNGLSLSTLVLNPAGNMTVTRGYRMNNYLECLARAADDNGVPLKSWQEHTATGGCLGDKCVFSHPFLDFVIGPVAGPMQNSQADNYCRNLVWDGRSDWEMPSSGELQKIAEIHLQYNDERFSDFLPSADQYFWDVYGQSYPYQAVNLATGKYSSDWSSGASLRLVCIAPK